MSNTFIRRAGIAAALALLLAAGASAETRRITLLGSSDIHGYFVPWDYATDTEYKAGALSKIATAVKRIRAEGAPVIVLDAGDLIQGNFTEKFRNEDKNPMVLGLNAIGYDLWVLGNHEFNFGMKTVEASIKTFAGKVLSGNIHKTDGGGRYLPASHVIESDGIRIGFVGMTTPMTMEFEKGTDNLKGIDIKKPLADTREAIAALAGKVDAIVGIMHMGEADENSIPETGVGGIVKAAPGIDAVFAGHMHLRVPGKLIDSTLLVEPGAYAQALSRVDLAFEKTAGGWKLVDKKSQLLTMAEEQSDPEIEAVYAKEHAALRADANSVIGKVVGDHLVPRDAIKGIPSVQVMDTPLVTLFHDACLKYSGADVVSLQIDNNAARLDTGDIKRKDIAFNYQYALGEISNYRMTGEQLKRYMEWSVDFFNTLQPGDVTISFNPVRRASKYSTNDFFGGIQYRVDLTRPSGNRVSGLVLADGRRVTPETSLVVGMNAYRLAQLQAKGGIFENERFEPIWDSKKAFGDDDGVIRALIVRYIREELKGIVPARNDHNWTLTGLDTALAREQGIVRELINRGELTVPSKGTFTNIASINVKGKVTHTPADYAAALAAAEARAASAGNDDARAAAQADIVLIKALKTF